MKFAHKIALFTTAMIVTGSVVAETRVDNDGASFLQAAQAPQVVSEKLALSEDGVIHGQSRGNLIFVTIDTPALAIYTNAQQQRAEAVTSATLMIEAVVEPARVASR